MILVKTFDATGVAPNGKLFAGDLNAIQAAAAGLTDLTQQIDLGSIRIGETGLVLSRIGSLEAQISGDFRVTKILRGLEGLVVGTYTTAQRNAIAAGRRPYGILIMNSDTNQLEQNKGTDAVPSWQPVSAAISAGSITATEISNTLKPSAGAAAGTEALRALGTAAGTAAAGTHASQHARTGADPLPINAMPLPTFNSQTGNYTLVTADQDKMVEMLVAGVNTVTVPPNSSVAFPIGTQITVIQTGAGQTTLAPGAGVTINASPGLKIAAQWGTATLIKRAADVWLAVGNLVP